METISKIIISAIENKFSKIYFYFNYDEASHFEITNEPDLNIEICKIITHEVNI